MTDSVGALAEKSRVEFQWLAIRVGMDSALRTADGIAAHRAMAGSLDSSIARYGDSMRLEGTGIVSVSGCLDWKATWENGAVDRAAFLTVLLRRLVRDSVGVVEWTVVDAPSSETRLSAIYTLPGSDGGSIDSATLRIEPSMVSIRP